MDNDFVMIDWFVLLGLLVAWVGANIAVWRFVHEGTHSGASRLQDVNNELARAFGDIPDDSGIRSFLDSEED